MTSIHPDDLMRAQQIIDKHGLQQFMEILFIKLNKRKDIEEYELVEGILNEILNKKLDLVFPLFVELSAKNNIFRIQLSRDEFVFSQYKSVAFGQHHELHLIESLEFNLQENELETIQGYVYEQFDLLLLAIDSDKTVIDTEKKGRSDNFFIGLEDSVIDLIRNTFDSVLEKEDTEIDYELSKKEILRAIWKLPASPVVPIILTSRSNDTGDTTISITDSKVELSNWINTSGESHEDYNLTFYIDKNPELSSDIWTLSERIESVFNNADGSEISISIE